MAKPPKEGQLLYHMTKASNVSSILRYGLMSRQELKRLHMIFEDVADPEILAKRATWPGTDLTSYVPFHFFAKNPFDVAIAKRIPENSLAIVAIKRSWAAGNEKTRVIPTHPLDGDAAPELCSYSEGYEKIKWELMEPGPNRDYRKPEIKKTCMAECLIPDTIHPANFHTIYVENEGTKKSIERSCDFIIQANPNMIQVNSNMFPRPKQGAIYDSMGNR